MIPDKETFLQGETIYLRPLRHEDIEGTYGRWLNDPEITRFNSHGRFPVTKEKLAEYVKRVNASVDSVVLAVISKDANLHIGNISLQSINWIDRNAEIAFLLGEKSYWGKGVMHEAAALLIQHAFGTLNLHRIHCGTSSENTGMQRLAEKLGMQREGVRKEAIFNNGAYHDIIEYGKLNTI